MSKRFSCAHRAAARHLIICALAAKGLACSSTEDDLSAIGGDASSPRDATSPTDAGRPFTGGGDDAGASDAGRVNEPDAGAPRAEGFHFDQALEGFRLGYAQPMSLASTSTATWDALEGHGEPGAVRIFADFSAVQQKLDLTHILVEPLDLRGKRLSVRVKLQSGLRSTAPFGGVKLFLKSSASYIYANGGETSLSANGQWIEISTDASNPAGYRQSGYDAADIREFGIELFTPYDGSPADVTPALVFIDDFEIL